MDAIARPIGTVLLSLVAGCAAFQADRPGDRGGDAGEDAPRGIAVDEVVLATQVDLGTLAPEPGTTSSSFPAGTREIYLCFQVVAGETGDRMDVAWSRQGDVEPLSTARLVVTGSRRMAASYDPVVPLSPGSYVVRLTAGESLVAEVPFVVGSPDDGGAPSLPAGLAVSTLRFQADEGGRPGGPTVTVLPPSTRRVHCSFSVRGAGPDTRLEVRWSRAGARLGTNVLGVPAGDEPTLSASLERTSPLAPGLYRVEVSAAGSSLRSSTFTVLGEAEPGSAGPRVSNLALTTQADLPTGRPIGPRLLTVWGDEPVLYLTLVFAGMPDDDVLEVRWYRDSAPGEPIATGSYQVSGRGSLAASFEPGDPLERGPHHVDVVRAGLVLGTLRFAVERPESAAPEGGEGSGAE